MSPLTSALQVALAAEQRADFGYGVLGPHLSAQTDKDSAATYQQAHSTLIAWCSDQLVARKQTPGPAAADYPDLYPIADDESATRLALTLEQNAAAAWRALFRATVAARQPAVLAAAQQALIDSAVRAAHWRGTTVPFPGT